MVKLFWKLLGHLDHKTGLYCLKLWMTKRKAWASENFNRLHVERVLYGKVIGVTVFYDLQFNVLINQHHRHERHWKMTFIVNVCVAENEGKRHEKRHALAWSTLQSKAFREVCTKMNIPLVFPTICYELLSSIRHSQHASIRTCLRKLQSFIKKAMFKIQLFSMVPRSSWNKAWDNSNCRCS